MPVRRKNVVGWMWLQTRKLGGRETMRHTVYLLRPAFRLHSAVHRHRRDI